MPKASKAKEFIELAEIRKLLRDKLTIRLNAPSGIYYYIKSRDFPLPTGLARPRKWKRIAVMNWVDRQAKKA